jgi:hypothetical protein
MNLTTCLTLASWVGFLQGLFITLFIFGCILLICVILIQKGRGGGLKHALEVVALALLAFDLVTQQGDLAGKPAMRRQAEPVDVLRSDWLCTIEPDGSVRLGLCYVNGLRAALGKDALRAALSWTPDLLLPPGIKARPEQLTDEQRAYRRHFQPANRGAGEV